MKFLLVVVIVSSLAMSVPYLNKNPSVRLGVSQGMMKLKNMADDLKKRMKTEPVLTSMPMESKTTFDSDGADSGGTAGGTKSRDHHAAKSDAIEVSENASMFTLWDGSVVFGEIRYEEEEYYTVQSDEGSDQIIFKTDVKSITKPSVAAGPADEAEPQTNGT